LKGALIQSSGGTNEVVLKLLEEGLKKGILGSVIVPAEVPARDSFTYLMIQRSELLSEAYPLPPVMAIQGAKVMRSITLYGGTEKPSAAVMRPCEARAAVELHNMKQADLTNTLLISFDCPGALPLSDYVKDPSRQKEIFEKAHAAWDREPMRAICKVCTNFSLGPADIHIASFGITDSAPIVIPVSEKGENFLESIGLKPEVSIETWESKVEELKQEKIKAKQSALDEWNSTFSGVDNLLKTLSNCINCHNCQRACPICYCRQCYFDSDALKLPSSNYLKRAERKGALRFPPDTLLFHLGRMSHMVLSCVSCGACEDACPMDIPVAQMFALVGTRAQDLFQYTPGAEIGQPRPLVDYRPEEFQEAETPYVEIYKTPEAKNA